MKTSAQVPALSVTESISGVTLPLGYEILGPGGPIYMENYEIPKEVDGITVLKLRHRSRKIRDTAGR